MQINESFCIREGHTRPSDTRRCGFGNCPPKFTWYEGPFSTVRYRMIYYINDM